MSRSINGKRINTSVPVIVIVMIMTAFMAWDLHGAVLGKFRAAVTDSEGNPVPGVTVHLKDTRDSATQYTITTRKNGIAIQVGLKNHVFEVTLEKEGYQPIIKQVKIPAGLLQEERFTMYTVEEAIRKQEANDPHAQAVRAFNEAAALIQQKKFAEAVALLNKSISLDNGIFQAHYYLGVVLYEQGKYKEALEPLLKALELNSDYYQAYRLLAAAHEKLGNKAEMEKYSKLAREKGGKTAIDAYNEGIHAFNNGDTEKSLQAFEEAVKLDAKFAEAYYRLGLSYLNKGDNEKAIANFNKYLELKPDGEDAETARSIIDSLK